MIQTLLITYLLVTIGNLYLLHYLPRTKWFISEGYEEPIKEVYYFNFIPVLQILVSSIVLTMVVLMVQYEVKSYSFKYEFKWYRIKQLIRDIFCKA